MSTRPKVLAVAAVGIVAATIAVLLFSRAFPVIGLENRLTQRTALTAADSFFSAHGLADSISQRAVRFAGDQEVLTFVDLAAGGSDTVNALVRGKDVALYDWSVRAFEPGNVHEASVQFAPDGRAIGFSRRLADADQRPDVGADSATALAKQVLSTWLGEPLDRWKVAATSYATKKPSERVDRTITFERTDKMVGEAPLRLDVIIGGNTPTSARPYVHVPESFTRRYAEMRSANDLLAIFATVGAILLFGLGVWTIRRFSYHGLLRWRPALFVGGVIGALFVLAGANFAGLGWYAYDTATPAPIFTAMIFAGAIAGGVFTALLVGLTLVAAEAAARTALPHQLDWWKLWRLRGTREVAEQVGGGYVVAAIAFAYVASFYMVTRGALGWWVPSELLDDPNQIATPLPWISGVAASLQAGVWEEALFRALPLSLLSLWVGTRPNRRWWMVAGVIATALVFGFAHASYPSWPPYSRGVEIFLDACFWGFLFLRFGLLVTVLAHFVYDLVLFSLFTATGTATEYRVSAAISAVILLLPALVVGWRWMRQGGFVPLPDDAHFGAWTKAPPAVPAEVVVAQPAIGAMSERSRQLAYAAVAGAIVLALTVRGGKVRGPDFTASRDAVIATADSMLQSRGTLPTSWRKLVTTSSDTQVALVRYLRENKLDSLAVPLARTYSPPAWWVVRYVRIDGTLAERAWEWRVRVYPDGKPLDIRHIVPDSAPGATLAPDSARSIARKAATDAGLDLTKFRESDFDETPRPLRRDVQVTWTDTTLKLPAGANARAWVSLAGEEPLVVRRGIQLPESFYRADREKQTRVIAMSGLLGAIFLGALVVGILYASKQRVALVHDTIVTTRVKWMAIVVLALSALVSIASGIRDTVFSYDTTTPWINHLVTLGITGLIAPLLGIAFLVGMWGLVEMLRRRSGIAAWPAPDAARDAIVAGLGIGAVFRLASLASTALSSPSIPGAPHTSLNQLWPMLDGVLGSPLQLMIQVVFTALVPLVIAVVARSNRTRWMIVGGAIALSVALLAPVAGSMRSGPPDFVASIAAIAGFAATVAAIVYWGPRSALTWLVAALTGSVISSLRGVLIADTNVERMSEALGLLLFLALLGGLMNYSARRLGDTSPAQSAGPDAQPAA